jgi:acyl carrier protein
MSDEIHERLQSIMREVFGDDELVITDQTTAAQVDGWDSLNHVNLIIAVEKRLGVKFATAEIASMKDEGQNIATFKQLITRKRAAK